MDDIKNYIDILHKRFFSLILCSVLSIILCILYLNTATPMYTAYMKIGPVDTSEQSSGSSGLGAAAGLVGISLGGANSSSNYLIFQETIKTTRLSEKLILKNDPRTFFYSSTYDPETNTFSKPKGLKNFIKDIVKNILNYPEWEEPSASSISNIIQTSVKKSSNIDNNFITYYFESHNKDFAKNFLEDIYLETEALIKQQQKEIALEKKDYYIDALAGASLGIHKQAIAGQILEQEKMLSKTGISTPISAMLIDDIGVLPYQTSPKRSQTLIFFIIVGFLFGYIYFVVKDIFLIKD
jgi:uncharacterized protein involved in exopolysaccharide biosynthesis